MIGDDTTPPDATVFHVCRRDEWEAALAAGVYHGSSQDQADGFIHCSSRAQVEASAAKHRAGQAGLVLVELDVGALGSSLRWEPSRRGQRFPHIYGPLSPRAAVRVVDLPLGADGTHRFPWHEQPDAR